MEGQNPKNKNIKGGRSPQYSSKRSLNYDKYLKKDIKRHFLNGKSWTCFCVLQKFRKKL